MASPAARAMPVKRVDESLLRSGVAVMPGGEDQLGRPLLVFPTTTPEMLTQRYTTAHLILLLRYYVTMTDVVTRRGGAAVVANLTTYSKDALSMVVDTLDKLQAEVCGSIRILYAILPKSKDAQKTLKKLLGLKPSKKLQRVPTFEAVLLESVPDLQRHIQRRHLTSDLGGTMTYNHRIWAELTQEADDLDEAVTSAIRRVPDAVDKVTMMSEYDVPTTTAEGDELLLQIRSKYNDIMRELNLEHLIDESKNLHERLSNPHKHEGYNDITHTVTFNEAKVKVVDYKNKLMKARERLKSLWQQAEGRILLSSKVNKYKEKAEKVTEWMQNVGLPTVNQDSDIADCLSKAEILKNHFETGFLDIAKNVLWLADKILKKFESVLQECGHQKQGGRPNRQIEPILAYTRQFQATTEYFRRAVEKKHQVYLNVHAFFLSAVKTPNEDKETSLSIYRQLQQITRWYKQTLKFLPVQLLIPSTRLGNTRPTSAAPYVSSAWRAAIEDFVLHHPLPAMDTLVKMKNVIPVIDNISIRNQARLLISRVTMIRCLLLTPEHLSPHDLQDILLWREQANKGQDEISLNMTTSTLDLSRLGEPDHTNSNPGHYSARQWQGDSTGLSISSETESNSTLDGTSTRTPKLRLVGVDENTYFDEYVEGADVKARHSRPKKHVHMQTATNGKSRDHKYGSVRPAHSEHSIHLIGQEGAPHVPRLDLRGITKSPHMQKSYTDRGGALDRKQSFGIYGDVDEQKNKKPHRRKIGRSVQNLSSTHEEGIQRQLPDRERYVSLSGADTPGASELPTSLKHINISALKKNIPQEQRLDHTGPSLGYHGGERTGLPHSYESLVDSGIAQTQSSAEGSGLSDSTNGLSPNLSVGHGRMSAVQEGNEQDLNSSHVAVHPSEETLAHAQSLPNLAYAKDGRLSLVQSNIDIIVNSPLDAEQKLKLMATMCECESVNSARSHVKSEEKEEKPGPPEPNVNNRQSLTQAELLKDVLGPNLAELLTETYLLEEPLPIASQVATNGRQGSQERTSKLAGAIHTQSPGQGQSGPVLISNKHKETRLPSPNPYTQPEDSNKTSGNARHNGDTNLGVNTDYNSIGNYVRSAGFGIDIEAWMRNQEEGSEVLPVEREGSDMTEDGMAEYVEKWKHSKENRFSEEQELLKARETLSDLLVQQEQLNQQKVERSLARTQQLLQEQEDLLQEDRRQRTLETTTVEEQIVGSGSPICSGTSPPSQALHQENLNTQPFKGAQSPSQHQEELLFTSSDGGTPPNRDGSVSGESGVFTLNSEQLKALETFSSSSTPRQRLSSSKEKLTQKEVLHARASLSRGATGGAGTKSGIVKQMDFRDMLRSITSEKDLGADGFNEALKAGDPLKCAEAISKSIEYKCEKLDSDFSKNQERNTGLCSADSGVGKDSSVTECSFDHNLNEKNLNVQKLLPSNSDSDITDDVFTSEEATPVNSPRQVVGESLKKWNHINLSQIQESNDDDHQNNGNQDRSATADLEIAKIEMVEQHPRMDCPEKSQIVVHEGKDYPEPNQILRNQKSNNISDANQMSGNISEAATSQLEKPILIQRSEVKEHADMKVKVEAGGGSAWTNAIPIPSYSMEFANLKTPIIIDNGSGMCKCGFADQDLPSAIFPALVGRAKYEDVSTGRMEENYVGSAAQSMRGVLKLHHPLEHGIITDWDDMESIWQHAFEEQLRVNPADHPVLVTEAPLNPRKNRERMMELLFETFQVPGVYFAIQAVLALYASGRTTGMVVDSGDGVSHFVPIYEGYSLPHAIQRLNLAGRDLTHYMSKLLYEKGQTFTSSAEQEIVRDIKEKHCYVSADFEGEMQRAESSANMEEFYTLPDGRSVSLSTERFRCPEVLFDPRLLGQEQGGIHVATYKSITKCEIDLRQELFSNIVLSGGTTMLPGFGDRLQQEVAALANTGMAGSVRVTSPDDRYFSVWQGGAVLASLPTFKDSWISYEEYLDVGSNIVHLKCF